ncbi:MAG: O-antigen ligase family protein [Verrucomicrobiota bacterium]
MKLERLPEYILSIVITLIAVVVALVLGGKAGAGLFQIPAAVLCAFFALLIVLTFRTRLWLLIPIFWPVPGKLVVLPVPFAVRELVILFIFALFLVFKSLKMVRRKPEFKLIDCVLFANLAYVAVTFLRNPVGVDAFGSERVGGYPYASALIAYFGYWVLARADLGTYSAQRLPIFFSLTQSIEAVIGTVCTVFPASVSVVSRIYSGIALGNDNTPDALVSANTEEGGRLVFLGPTGRIMSLALCSFFRPLTLINPLYFFRFITFITAISLILLSGFRSAIFLSALMFAVASILRGKTMDVLKVGIIVAPMIAILVLFAGTSIKLPMAAQRALSFLPGNWSATAKEDARGSTEWRVEMWKVLWSDRHYLQNRWLGDGFGFTKVQFREMIDAKMIRDARAGQENMLIAGQVHSGPFSAIKYVGVVGLAFFLLLLLISAREAKHLIKKALGTPFSAVAMFFGIPIIVEPFFYVFIFGGYDCALPEAIFRIGMLKVISAGLAKYRQQETDQDEISNASLSEPRSLPSLTKAKMLHQSNWLQKGANERIYNRP